MQIGRAGRDGSESYCHLFLDDADFLRLRSLAHSDGIDATNALAFLKAVFESNQSQQAAAGGGGAAEGGEGGGGVTPVYGTLAVAQVAELCDMKEEVMETLLSYLEASALSDVHSVMHTQQCITLNPGTLRIEASALPTRQCALSEVHLPKYAR